MIFLKRFKFIIPTVFLGVIFFESFAFASTCDSNLAYCANPLRQTELDCPANYCSWTGTECITATPDYCLNYTDEITCGMYSSECEWNLSCGSGSPEEILLCSEVECDFPGICWDEHEGICNPYTPNDGFSGHAIHCASDDSANYLWASDNSCHYVETEYCLGSQPQLFDTEPFCLLGGGYWYNSVCNLEPESLPVCGNGLHEGDEECDDGDLQSGDGCSETCTVEDGYECIGEPSVCLLIEGGGFMGLTGEQINNLLAGLATSTNGILDFFVSGATLWFTVAGALILFWYLKRFFTLRTKKIKISTGQKINQNKAMKKFHERQVGLKELRRRGY